MNDLVSIIMLSRNNGEHVIESVESVQSQTYQNWELIFLDDRSNDDTITQLMEIKEHDRRLSIFQTVEPRGMGINRLSAMKEVKGVWLAFLDTGDLWEPTKLERQISYMKENGYSFSYTNYKSIDENRHRASIVSGPATISNKEMQKCCWMGTLTVICRRDLIDEKRLQVFNANNDYGMWLQASDRTDCHLLDECLAKHMKRRSFIKRLSLPDKISWRYEVYRKVEDLGRIVSAFMTIRNMYYSIKKRFVYHKRVAY